MPEGYVQLLVDEGERMAMLLRRAVRHFGINALPPPTVGFVGEVLARVQSAGPLDKMGEAAAVLSPRERQVLVQLNLGLTNKRIARSLELTEATVKFHLRDIYGKLGASGRVMALSIARRRGLLK